MRVLQTDAGGDMLWWVGDGKAVAIQKKKLSKGALLDSHFNIKDYAVFSRNLNRWGFRRTFEYPVPDGVRVYQCSLFSKGDPHLLHHMRMDSDVQDIFSVYSNQAGGESGATAASQGAAAGFSMAAAGADGGAAAAAAMAARGGPTLQPPAGLAAQPFAAPASASVADTGGMSGLNANNPSIRSFLQGLGGSSAGGRGYSSPTQGLSLTHPVAAAVAASLVPDSAAYGGGGSGGSGSNEMMQRLVQAIHEGRLNQQRQRTPSPPQQEPEAVFPLERRSEILNRIVHLSKLYRDRPDRPQTQLGETIQATMDVLQVHAAFLQEEQKEEHTQQTINFNLMQALELETTQADGNASMASAGSTGGDSRAQQQQQESSSSSSTFLMELLIQLQSQQSGGGDRRQQQQQQQQQHGGGMRPQEPVRPAPLPSFLQPSSSQSTSLLASLSQQQQQQQQRRQQSPQHSSRGSAGGAQPTENELLLYYLDMVERQKEQQNRNK